MMKNPQFRELQRTSNNGYSQLIERQLIHGQKKNKIRGAVNDRIVHEAPWVSGLVNVANGLTKDTDAGNNIHYLLAYNRLAVSTKRGG